MIPWLHRFTDERGLHLACCAGLWPGNQLRDDQGNALSVHQRLSDEQVLNCAGNKAMRLAMLKGEWSPVCDRCRRSEEAGAVSLRQQMNKRFKHWRKQLLEQTLEDGTLLEPRVRYADIRLGNTCNLTCRMCWPGASARWIKHFNRVQPKGYAVDENTLQSHRRSWVKQESALWLIEQCLPSVESLNFAGGEPLIIPEMPLALDLCIRSGRSSQIDLFYNTNLTALPRRVTRLWPHFRSVSLLCSVDGFGRLNDYIRRPSKWADIDRNLRLVDRHFEEWKIKLVLCSATVQIYNVLQLGDLFRYLDSGFEHVIPMPQLTPLYTPDFLSISNLPAGLKQNARASLLELKDQVMRDRRAGTEFIAGQIDTVIAHLGRPGTRKALMDFLYFSEKSDREFGDSWRQAAPALANGFLPELTGQARTTTRAFSLRS